MAQALDYESLNENVRKVQLAVRGQMYLRASELQMEGEEIIVTNVGNPLALEQKPLTFPRQVVALCQAPFLLEDPNVGLLFPADAIARAKHYLAMTSGGSGVSSDSRGLPGIRKEVAEFIERRDGYPSDPELIFLTDGAIKGVLHILNAIIRGERDGILGPVPQYPLYSAAKTLFGGTHLPYCLEETANWVIDANDLRNAVTEACRKGITARALIIVNPGNPTGQCLSESNLREILHFCYEENLVLLGDEVYQQNINHDERPFISARKVLIEMGPPFSREVQLVSFHSVSKGYWGESGQQGGYFEMFNISPETVDEIYKVASISLSPNVPAQICMALMVNPPKSEDISCDQYITEKMKDSRQQQLVSPVNVEHHLPPNNTSITTVFVPGSADIPPITSIRIFFREFYKEMIKLWYIAGPAIFTMICLYCLGASSQVFLGHVSTIALAAFAIENMVICSFTHGAMYGMGSALETLCGQAFGAGQLDMLGIYMQRSWIIVFSTSCIMLFVYIFATPILKLIRQTDAISEATGTFALYMIPQLFAMAFNFPMQKFLQAQSMIMVVAIIAGVALVLHVLFSWLLIIKLKLGLGGAALMLNVSWWLIVLLQFLYIVGGSCRKTWKGFSWKAFHNLWAFVKLSVASAVMIVLETWYFMILVICAGYLKNAEISVNALSISMNILGATLNLALGINAAISVRVSNELGAGHPRATKLSLLTAVVSSAIIGVVLVLILIIARSSYPSLFSNNVEVQKIVRELTPLLALSIIVNNVQPVLSGMAIGAGWQAYVAYVNIACYYVFGIPLGVILGLKFDLGVKGIWYGMLSGTTVQTFILFLMAFRKNWVKEASIAEDRIKKWGGIKESNASEAT